MAPIRILPSWQGTRGWAWAWALALLAVVAVLYWPGLRGPLIFDDFQNLRPVHAWLQGEMGARSVVFGNGSGLLGRPVSMLSFVLNAAASGDGVFGFKAGNLILHLLNGLLVWKLFVLLGRRAWLAGAAPSHWVPLFAAAFWLLHPLLVSTVLYVVQRMAMLAASFMLAAMIVYVHGRDRAMRDWRYAIRWLALLAVLTLLAALSKENGLLVPSLCAVLELACFRTDHGQARRPLARAVLVGGIGLPLLLGLALVAMRAPFLMEGYANRSYTMEQRVLTEFRVLWSYVGGWLLPQGPALGLYHDDYAISRGWLQPASTLVSALAWLATVVFAWLARRAAPGILAGVGIFLVGHGLESTIFPLLPYFEHRNYLPATGLTWAVLSLAALGWSRIARQLNHPAIVQAFAGVSLLLVLAISTAARARVWASWDTLLAQGLRHHPTSRWALMDASRYAMDHGNPEAARGFLERLQQSPEPSTHILGVAGSLLVDCLTGTELDRSEIESAFPPRDLVVESDLLLMYEAVLAQARDGQCKGLDAGASAGLVTRMLDHSRLRPDDYTVVRLRFNAARSLQQAGRTGDALDQMRLATRDAGSLEPAIWLFLAQLEGIQGHPAAAKQARDRAARLIRADDRAGQEHLKSTDQLLNNVR